MGYGYDASGKTFAYKMGTSNAKFLLKGATKVPKNTLFFIGERPALYAQRPFLEDGNEFGSRPGLVKFRTGSCATRRRAAEHDIAPFAMKPSPTTVAREVIQSASSFCS